ncbi:MAG: NAD-glutamate dehydrogenase, partial [Zetaproteobacteria bacterium]
VRVHDGPDPYLVVAADKGTARFSDDANDEASRAGFWLGDAFASGGSHGYDHKKLGITAKGAWVCCAHHLQKLGLDAWRDPIRVVGIGDMSGDVFGNGMLLNPHLLLIAAFNHRWIFVDPTPNAEAAFRERKRLFEQALDWEHYNRRVISQGGGVFPRQARAIPLSAPMRKALGIKDEAETISGEALIRAILRAPVDVLYNGGIGTYVKASTETHAEVRDPANNAVRVDAKDLRCKVVVEGGNLGLTPKARIEFAARGGLVNADAVDNAAGVHISDREVNMKLLLRRASRRRRDALLERLADAVVAQCLDAQLAQARALSLGELDARRHPPRWRRLVKRLEAARLLDAFTAAGLAPEALHLRPVLATLLGQEKNRIKRALAKAAFGRTSRHRLELLSAYFPEPLARRRRLLAAHPLADAIVVTEATNHLLNHFGIAAISQLEDMTGRPPAVLAEALLVADALLDASALIRRLWEAAPTVEVAAEMASEAAEMVLAFTEEGLRLGEPARLG